MSDIIIVDGDQVVFQPAFGAATVIPVPGNISGSGKATFNSAKLCIEGDESTVRVEGVTYFTPVYSIPGTGTLLIDQPASDQVAKHTKTGGAKMILKGGNFTAKFQVQAPAMQPPPGAGSPVPDPTTVYSGGKGSFISFNSKLKGT